jgi:hypothetical protein
MKPVKTWRLPPAPVCAACMDFTPNGVETYGGVMSARLCMGCQKDLRASISFAVQVVEREVSMRVDALTRSA